MDDFLTTKHTIYVLWHDNYSNPHNSAVYFIDSRSYRFMI